MQVQLTPYHARMIANNVDYNWNGQIDRNELRFMHNSKRLVDTNRDGRVSTEELAQSLMRGDIYISNDRKAYPTYRHGYGHPPAYGRPGYGPRPIFGQPPYGGYQPPYPQAPGYPYQYNQGGANIGRALGVTAVGVGLGAGVAYAVSAPLATGAAIGGAIGLIGSLLFN